MHIYARQGDLVIDKLSVAITGDLEKATGLVLAGRDSAPHVVRGTVQMRRNGRRTLLRVAEATIIEHAGRHHSTPLEPGDYEARPLRERGDGADREVDD